MDSFVPPPRSRRLVPMGRCGGTALYLMAIVVLLVALFASSAKCRPEPLDHKASSNGRHAMELNSTAASVNGSSDDKASSNNGHAMTELNSTATTTSVNGSSGGDVKLVWCLTKNCVYEGRGNAICFCCAAMKPNSCYETRDQCNRNCV